ncbi:MAG: cell envelope integrity protein TolA [Gammaproteobacteria bacterium]|nr:cell envelope integrity protein TolA [Gammaproteobacteria bacterium]
MLEMIKKHPRYAIGAILVHVFFLILFGVSFHFKSDQRAASTQPPTVQVTTVDEKQVEKELQSMKAQDERARREKEELIRQRKSEEKRLADLRAQRQAEQKKQQERIALEKEQEKIRKQKQAEEQRKKEQERKRQEEEQRREQAKNEQALKQQLAAEAQRMKAEQAAAAQRRAALQARQTEIDKYMNAIENRIYQNWIMPPSTNSGLVCELQVQLIPGGEVINIELSKSSGDPVYDQSVIAAVKAASPLPVPSAESGLFDEFRTLTLPVRADKKM